MKIHYMMRMAGKELNDKIMSMDANYVSACNSKDMTLFTLIPHDLHGSYVFKVLKTLLSKIKNASDSNLVKSSIFMTIYVEQNAKWLSKLNNQMRKCYEKFEDLKSQQTINSEMMSEFEGAFVKAAMEVETAHDFESEIKAKKEA